MSQISKHSNENFNVEDDLIKIKTGKLPIKIISLETKDNKILGMVGFKGASTSTDNLNIGKCGTNR